MEWRYLIELRDTWWQREDVAWNILREIHATYTHIIRYKCREVCLYYGQQTRERLNMQSECEGMGCGEWNGHIGQTTRIVLGRFLFLIVDYTVQFSSRRIYSLPGNDSFYPLGINSFQMNHDLRFAAFGNRPSTQTRLPFRSKIWKCAQKQVCFVEIASAQARLFDVNAIWCTLEERGERKGINNSNCTA